MTALVASVAALLAVPVLLARRKTRSGLRARLGFHAIAAPPTSAVRMWVHAASAGDVKNAWPAVAALVGARPDLDVVLTVVTDSGAEMAGKVSPAPTGASFLPLDAPGPVRRTLRAFKPDVVVLEMTELWPTLVEALRRRGIPVVVSNARLSPRSLARYRSLRRWFPDVVPALAAVCAQTEEDARRWKELGVPPERVHVTGNCKFDAAARTPAPEKVAALRAEVGGGDGFVVAGSTHAGEEDVVLDALLAARAAVPGTRLLWAPRYLDHADNLVKLASARGLRAVRKSRGPSECAAADVVVVDSMGQLAAAYALGRVAVVGGSFTDRGGQNILEPAACGLPVLHGPDMALAPDQVRALDGHGAKTVTAAELPGALVHWLTHPDEARAEGDRGRERVQATAGAAARHLQAILPVLPAPRR